MTMRNIALFITILCMQCYNVRALTEEEMKAEFAKFVMKCMKHHPVEPQDLLQLQQWVLPKKPEVYCLLACAYKLEGTMDSKGKFDLQHAYAVAEMAQNGDEKRLINGKKLADTCFKVNDVEVNDDEKGCKRAALIFKCSVENIPKLGFKLA